MSSNTREIKDVFYLVALQGINYVMPLIVFPYLMITLGAEKFGYIGFSISVIQYLMLIVDFGFNFTATKKIAIHKNNQTKIQEIFWATLYAKIALLVVSFALLLTISFAIPRFHIYRSTLFAFSLMVAANTFSFVWFFQGLSKIRIVSIVNIFSKLLILPLIFLFVKNSNDYLRAAYIQSSVYVFSSLLIVLILIRKRYIISCLKPNKDKIISEVKSAFPVFISGAASSIYVLMFVIVLGYFSSPEGVGKYTAAEKIVRSFCYLIFIPISQAFFPKVSALSRESMTMAWQLIKKISIFTTVAMSVVFLVLFFFSNYLIMILGKDYAGIGIIFKIMAIIPMFVALGGVFGQLGLLALGNEQDKKYYQNTYLVAGVVALITILILVPFYGVTGASVALLLTEFIVSLLLGIKYFQIIKK